MTGSSISTYLDVTRASQGNPVPESSDSGVSVDEAAKILSAVRGGTNTVDRLSEETGFAVAHVVALVGLMAESDLLGIETDPNGLLHVRLTEATAKALAS